MPSTLNKSREEILLERAPARQLFENMSLGKLFDGNERGFRNALMEIFGTDEQIDKIRNMTVGQFLQI